MIKPSYDICVITTIHPPYDARIYERGTKSLAEAGYNVALLAPWPPIESVNNITLYRTVMPLNRRSRFWSGFKIFYKAIGINSSSYHFHDLDFIVWAVLLKYIKNVPVIYDCHENYPEEIIYGKQWIPLHLRRPLGFLIRKIENIAARLLKNVIVVVPNLLDRFNALGCNTTMVRNFSSWAPAPQINHERNLIYIGTISEAYGSEILLEIARLIKQRNLNLELIIVDKFADNQVKHKFVEAITLGNLPIKIKKRVHPSEIGTLLQKGSLALSVEQNTPNMQLGYHAKLFEYMAFGLPIIASNIRSNAMIIKESGAGVVVDSDNAIAYLDAAEKILTDSEAFGLYKQNGFNAIETIYNWKTEKLMLIKKFAILLGKKGSEHKVGIAF